MSRDALPAAVRARAPSVAPCPDRGFDGRLLLEGQKGPIGAGKAERDFVVTAAHQAELASDSSECDTVCRELVSRWEARPTR